MARPRAALLLPSTWPELVSQRSTSAIRWLVTRISNKLQHSRTLQRIQLSSSKLSSCASSNSRQGIALLLSLKLTLNSRYVVVQLGPLAQLALPA